MGKEANVTKPLAVIIKGNPKYLDKKEIKPIADEFYKTVKNLLEEQGFHVTFDSGEDFTKPDIAAKVWVAHSRGIGRLQYAPDHIKTVALDTKNGKDGTDPKHYQLSSKDIKNLNSLKEEPSSGTVPLTLNLLDEYIKFRQQSHKESDYVNALSKNDAVKQISEQNKDNKTALVALKDGEIVGQLFVTAPTKKRNIAIINLISVLESEQGTGLAHRLMKKAIWIAEDADCDKLQLIVNNKNEKAIKFYKKHNFKPINNYSTRATTYELDLPYDRDLGDHEYR